MLGQKWTDFVILGFMEDTLVVTPWMQTRVWREEELSVRGVSAVPDIGPSMATLIRTSVHYVRVYEYMSVNMSESTDRIE